MGKKPISDWKLKQLLRESNGALMEESRAIWTMRSRLERKYIDRIRKILGVHGGVAMKWKDWGCRRGRTGTAVKTQWGMIVVDWDDREVEPAQSYVKAADLRITLDGAKALFSQPPSAFEMMVQQAGLPTGR